MAKHLDLEQQEQRRNQAFLEAVRKPITWALIAVFRRLRLGMATSIGSAAGA
jgi:hypothetical protein